MSLDQDLEQYEYSKVEEVVEHYKLGRYHGAEILKEMYDIGNARGLGEAIGYANETPVQAAETEGYEVLGDFNDCFNSILVHHDGEYAVVGDSNGPWLIPMLPALLELATEEEP